MLRMIRKPEPEGGAPGAVRKASVCEVSRDGGELDSGLCRVAVGQGRDRSFAWASIATVAPYRPEIGDQVLIAWEGHDEAYVIGVLKRSGRSEPARPQLRASSGASARLVDGEAGEEIQIRDREGQLVCAYDAEGGRATLSVPNGDLALQAPNGFVDLVAGRGVRCFSPGPVEFESRTGVGLRVRSSEGKGPTGIQLSGRGMALASESLSLVVDQGQLRVKDMSYEGHALNSRVDRARVAFGKLESVVERMFARAGEIYRKVEGVEHVEAGQMRTRVEGVHTVEAQASHHRTKGDVRIDGAHIHLG